MRKRAKRTLEKGNVPATINIFLFEDTQEDRDAIMNSLLDAVPGHIRLQVFWFSEPLTRPAKPYAGDSYPYVPESDSEQPLVFRRQQMKWVEYPASRPEWWQSDFHCAIIDIFNSTNGEPEGELYLSWLNRSAFSGPVAAISLRSLPTQNFASLPLLFRLPKSGKDWPVKLSHKLNKKLGQVDWSIPLVNFHGRSQADALRKFFEHERALRRALPEEWTCLWVGDDEDLREQFISFFNFLDSGRIDDWKTFLMNLDDGSDIGTRPPSVIVIDAGKDSTVNRDSISGVTNFAESLSNIDFICVILADREADISDQVRSQMDKFCISLLPRDKFIDSPTHWAASLAERFATSYRAYSQSLRRNRESIEVGRTLARDFIPAYLMARSVGRVCGDGVGSIVSWLLGTNPVKTSFAREFRDLVQTLVSRDCLHPRFAGMFERKGPGRTLG